MLDFDILDSLVDLGAFFSINETNMTVIAGVDESRYFDDSNGDFHRVDVFKNITSFPLGDNLFNFLFISVSDFKKIWGHVEDESYWDGKHAQNEFSTFLSSLDCTYLYLTYHSFNRGHLGLQYRARLDRIAKEFEFALNFCCNDDFNVSLKQLSALQRYYIYCQLYVDNTLTIDRQYNGPNNLFIEAGKRIDNLDRMSRKGKNSSDFNTPNDYEPITDVPDLSGIADVLKSVPVFIAYRYQYSTIDKYLLEELFSLIKLNVRVKKCKNCDKYFILKGDYATDYCDRIPDGQKFTCKKIAAMKARKKKVQNNPILKEYEKAYKRMYARLSNHKLSNEDFRLWVEDASRKRDSAAAEYSSGPSGDIINQFKEYLGNK